MALLIRFIIGNESILTTAFTWCCVYKVTQIEIDVKIKRGIFSIIRKLSLAFPIFRGV